MSQQEVIEAAWSQLPHNLRAIFVNSKNGEWDILEVPEGVDPTKLLRASRFTSERHRWKS